MHHLQKYIGMCLLLLMALYGHGYQLSGTITDEQGNPLPFVSVYVENTTYGVASNLKGVYYMELDDGQYRIAFQSVGYERKVVTVTINGSSKQIDVTLKHMAVELEAVTVAEDKRDVAMEVIRKTIASRRKYLNQYEGYRCDTYIKASLEKEYFDKKDSIMPRMKRDKLNFIESYGNTYWQAPGKLKEVKTAYRDLAEKKSATVRVEVNSEDDDRPGQGIQHNPYLFFTTVADGDFNFYRNLLNIPKLGETPFVSPIAATAPLSYKYIFVETFFEDGVQINKIEIQPRNSEGALFSGHLYIVEDSWALKAADLYLNGSNLYFYKNFRIIQNYSMDADSIWTVKRQEFFYNAKDGRKTLLGHTTAVHSNYVINPDFGRKFFDNELRRIEDDAYDRDSVYWNHMRPITLKKAELDYIHKQDSIITYENSEPYLRERDSTYNRVNFWDVTVNGMGFRNRAKGTEIFIYSLLQSVRPFSVGGYHHALGGSYSKEWTKANKLKSTQEIDYGFLNGDVTGFLRLSYLYKPKKFGRFYVKGGNIYSMVNRYESIAATFSRGNYVAKRFFGVGHEIELRNGLFLDVETEYATRRAITNLQLSQWSDDLFGDSLNTPREFEEYDEVLLDIRITYTPAQQYYTEPYKKIIVGSKYPTFKLTYRKGVRDLLSSDVDYDFLELNVTDDWKAGTAGESKVNLYAGSFVRSQDIRLVDQKFFRGSDYFFYSNPLKSFQLLGPTLPTKKNYFQAHYIHHFNGMLLNKVPLIKKLRLQTVAGAGILFIDDVTTLDSKGFRHGEAYVGLEKEFVLWRQLMKFGTYYVAADSNHSDMAATFKFGIDFFNSFTNSWSY